VAIQIFLQDLIKLTSQPSFEHNTPLLETEAKCSKTPLDCMDLPRHLFSHTVNCAIVNDMMDTDRQNTKFFQELKPTIILLASASTLAIKPFFNEDNGVPSGRSTTGILAKAQPEAVVMSALEQTTALGAFPYSFIE
jgi:hypothetical protein